jgi:hypothetical protein
MTCFLLGTDAWLKEAKAWSLPLVYGSAIALPLSRTLEPTIFLVGAVVVLAVFRFRRGTRTAGSSWVPIAAAAIGVAAVGVPVFLRLQSQLTAYTEQGILPSGSQLARLFTDFPLAVARSFPLWPAVVVVVIFALLSRRVRHALGEVWWVWVLLLTPLMFTMLFLLTTDPTQPLFDRYLFTWVPLLAICVCAIVSTWRGFRSDVFHSVSVVAVGLLLMAGFVQLAVDLSTTERPDWKALSAAIEDSLPVGSVILFDQVRPLGEYRTFAVRQR